MLLTFSGTAKSRALTNDFDASASRVAPPSAAAPVPARRRRYFFKTTRGRSNAEKVELELRIALLLGPEIKRQCGELVDHWHSESIFGQVDGLDVGMASLTGFYADIVKIGSSEYRQLVAILLATV